MVYIYSDINNIHTVADFSSLYKVASQIIDNLGDNIAKQSTIMVTDADYAPTSFRAEIITEKSVNIMISI